MAKSKKIKIFIALFYFFLVSLFLYFIFTKYSFEEITSYEFIKNNQNYFYELRQSNLFILGLLFIFFAIVWVFAAGFGSPLALVAGFIFVINLFDLEGNNLLKKKGYKAESLIEFPGH